MFDERWLITGLAVLWLGVGVMILRTQAKATSCSRHSRVAGMLAVPIGWGSLVGGVGLLGYGVYLLAIA